MGSSLALYGFFSKLGKTPAIVSEAPPPAVFEFLPNFGAIKNTQVLERDFVVEVDTSKVKLDEISYHSEGSRARIFLRPQGGIFKPEDISFSAGSPDYDLIICADVPSLDRLGNLYSKNADLFFNTTKINIDNGINDENYANLNLVDITSATTAEIVMDLIKKYGEYRGEPAMDIEIASCLLAGIISETNCFQSGKTTPNSFACAAELVNLGANQQEIVRRLYKTKSLAMLRILGRAMARLKQISSYEIYCTQISAADAEKTGASEGEILQAMRELVGDIADAKMVFFVIEREAELLIYIYAIPNIKIAEIANNYGGEIISDSLAKIRVAGQLAGAENFVNGVLEQTKARLGIGF